MFDRLTVGGTLQTANEDQALAAHRRALQQSVLDFVMEDAAQLQKRLGKTDQVKLDQFLTSVRSLETRLASSAGTAVTQACSLPARPTETYSVDQVPEGYNRDYHADLMIDLLVMAFQCDLTRVASFMLDDSRSDFVYDFLEEREFTAEGSTIGQGYRVAGYHGLQHAGDENNGFATIGYWNAAQAARLASRLRDVPDQEGNLLDNTVITFASGMHGGNHQANDLPIALLGGGGKTGSGTVLGTDRHIVFADEARLADVHLTLLQQVFGLPLGAFGSSSGPIAELLS